MLRIWFALSKSSPLQDELVPVAFYLLHHHRCSFCPHSSRDLQLRVWVLVAFDVELRSFLGLGMFVYALRQRHIPFEST